MIRRALPLAALALVASVGCGGAATSGGETTSTTSDPLPVDTTTTTNNTVGSIPSGGSTGVLAFDAPSEVSCTAGSTALVSVTYRTTGLVGVALVVDGQTQPATASTAPSTDDTDDTDDTGDTVAGAVLEIPCDDNVHTVMLIGSGPEGPAFASKAVVTRAT